MVPAMPHCHISLLCPHPQVIQRRRRTSPNPLRFPPPQCPHSSTRYCQGLNEPI
ncbi:hypothetical protein BDQ17DRAFT_1376189, partial [Cyathus striatus]